MGENHMRITRRLPLLLALFTAVTVAACTGTPAEKAITSFDGEPRAFHGLEVESVRHPADLREAALEHIDDKDPQIHFAAFYALTLTAVPGPSMVTLGRYLKSGDVNERLAAAGALVSRGQTEGLPVIIDALDSEETLVWMDPPLRGWQIAKHVLATFTDQDLGITNADDLRASAATKPAWKQWYSENGARLRWDPGARKLVR